MKKALRSTVVLLVGAITFGGGQTALAATTRLVDDDGAQCENTQFTSINAAVAAAQPGDTIKVCPGTYPESVNVNKDRLKLEGSTNSLNEQACLSGTGGTNPARDSIVQPGAAGPGFNVTANKVRIRNFTIQMATGPNGPGVFLHRAWSGYRVEKNIVQANVFGVYLNSNGRFASTVKQNCIRNNNRPGSASGNGVYSDQGVRKADVDDNTFTAHTNASVILVGGGGGISQWHVDLKVENNAIVNDASIIAVNTVRSSFSRNRSTNSNGSGIFFGGNVSDTLVKSNRIVDCAFTGINMRFLPGGAPAGAFDVTQPNFNNTVSGNQVTSCGDWGIGVRDGSSYNTVKGNRADENGLDGYVLQGAVGNEVRGNVGNQNGRDGLRAETQSQDNLIQDNTFQRNVEHDCHDDTVGNGTVGTANFWEGNNGTTENRPGLCRGDDDDDDDNDDDDDDNNDEDDD